MKKTILIILSVLTLSTLTTSCGDARIKNAVVVEQINILEGKETKYEVKLQTDVGSQDAFYYTNFRFQVGDSLVSYFENFEKNSNNNKRVMRENDSLRKELTLSNYYLAILKEKFMLDTLKRK